MAIIEAFDSCSPPPVLYGTGRLFVGSGSDEIDCGNFSLVDFVGDGESRRVFRGSSELASAVAVTAAYRLEATGDSFSGANLARLLNEDVGSGSQGEQMINLRTVRDAPLYSVRFQKLIDPTCRPRYMNIYIWRAMIDVPFTYTFSQDEQTVHRFVFTAIPDPINYPTNPLGMIVVDP